MTDNDRIQFQVPQRLSDQRLDFVLSAETELSRSYAQKLIEAGHIEVNGVICSAKKQKVFSEDTLSLYIPPPEKLEALPENIPLCIVYEDEDVLIVNKPKGMVVHPAPGNESGTLVNAVLYHCGNRLSTINGMIRPGIVHRIDKDTSGLLMIAKSDMAHHGLAQQLALHSIRREYRAIVHNNFTMDEGTVDAPIGRDPKNRLRQAVSDVHARRAVTHYRVLERFGRFTYIEARLETGRTHQIRVHMAHIKHPILGDPLYGPVKKIGGLDTQMLHAGLLGFIHPRTGVQMEFQSQLPEEFVRILGQLQDGKWS